MTEVPVLETLDEATLVLGKEYRAWKVHGTNKDDAKAQFFNNAVEELRRQVEDGEITLRTKVAEVVLTTLDKDLAKYRLEQRNPRFTVKSIRPVIDEDYENGDPITYEAILEEDVFYLPFYYVNLEDGYKYERRCDDGAIMLDDDRLKEENPDLYERAMYELPWGDYVPRPVETLSTKDQTLIREYIYQGTPKLVLPAPKQATEEELEEVANRG